MKVVVGNKCLNDQTELMPMTFGWDIKVTVKILINYLNLLSIRDNWLIHIWEYTWIYVRINLLDNRPSQYATSALLRIYFI